MKLTLLTKKHETPDVISFVFKSEETLVWQAGQFLHYVLHHEPTDDRGSDRWFTISSAPHEKHIQITTRLTADKGSSFKLELQKLPIGKSIEVSYLSGDFTITDPKKEFVFIAGGIGITPFRSILSELNFEKKPINITLLYANSDQHVVFKDELESIAKSHPTFTIHYIFSPEHIDEQKIKDSVILEAKPIESLFFFVSGPEVMVDAIIKILKHMNIAEDKIKGDWFPNYKPF